MQGLESVRSVTRTSPAPLSFYQEQLWFLARLFPDVPIYNDSITIHIDDEIDSNILERSFNQIIERHEILRTNFMEVEGQPVQRVAEEARLEIPVVDLRSSPAPLRELEANRLATERCRRIFDLASELPLRVSLFRLDEFRYKLFVTLHHIVYDGRSLILLYQELREIHRVLSTGQPPRLSALPVQYADFAGWQREWVKRTDLTGQLEYWKRQLAGELPLSELPTDHAFPVTQGFRGAKKAIEMSVALSRQLDRLAQQEHATLYAVLLSAYLVLLHRYSDQQDLLVGTTTTDRHRPEIEPLIGYFTNTLALRFDLSRATSFRALLQHVQAVIRGANDHGDLPFTQLVNAMNPERSLSRTPLFQTYFNFEPPLAAPDPNWSMSFMDLDTGAARFELSLILENWSGRIAGCFEYSTELFEPDRIERMAEHFVTLLKGIVADPDTSVRHLPLLSPDEQNRLLVEWNRTECEGFQDVCVQRLFETQVEKTPNAIAVEFESLTLTYRELNDRAERLAGHLRSLGIGPEWPVAICVERSLEMVVGLLGILKSGGVYLPLDPDFPAERLRFILHDARTGCLLTQATLAAAFEGTEVGIICLDSQWDEFAEAAGIQSAATGVTLDHLAYLIYTSGSTGQAKGVGVTHRALSNHMQWMHHAFPLAVTDRVFQKTPYCFDASIWEFLAPLIAGARLVIARPGGHQDVAYLIETIVARGITILQTIPSLLSELLDDPRIGNCRSLRRIFSGGEPLTPGLRDRVQRCLDAELCNLYGPTEATIDATYYRCGSDRSEPVPIGRPIANTRIYILDRDLQPVPIGVAGELHIGGAGLARGYLNRPELTAGKFIANPFDDKPGTRLYKTGDRARYRSDGHIEYLGRMDQQVKIRGHRMELGEIERVLSQYPGVRSVAVCVFDRGENDRRLAAFVVADPNSAASAGELREFLTRTLPEYMIPSAYIFLDSLPLNANGKLDRRALPEPDWTNVTANAVFVAPRNVTEAGLAGIWEDVLGVNRIGIHDNFFELGGHSLLAIRIVSRIRERLAIELPLSALFTLPTVAKLAAVDWPKCDPLGTITRRARG